MAISFKSDCIGYSIFRQMVHELMIIDNKKWIKDTIAHNNNFKVPYHFDFTPPVRMKLEEYYKSNEIEDILEMPIRWGSTKSIKPLYTDPNIYQKKLTDEFGVTWIISGLDRGVPIPCLYEPDLSNYEFPNPNDLYRFKDLDNWCQRNNKYYRVLWAGDLWERATFMRGMENILMDIKTEQRFIRNLLGQIANYCITTMEILNKRFDFEAFAISDDYGTQLNLLLSPDDWRLLIKPHLIEISQIAKKARKEIMLHSCGNIYSIIPDLIEVGIDILHPIQPEAMDIYKLKKEYGKYITFQGGIGTQNFLTRCSPQKIKKEIKRVKKEIGKNGGYIMEPGITMQIDIPLKNIISMIEVVKKELP